MLQLFGTLVTACIKKPKIMVQNRPKKYYIGYLYLSPTHGEKLSPVVPSSFFALFSEVSTKDETAQTDTRRIRSKRTGCAV